MARSASTVPSAPARPSRRPPAAQVLPVSLETRPMEARAADELPSGPGWQFEPKWDGFRCLAFRAGDTVELRAKSGKPLSRYFPEVLAMLRALPADNFVLDGELVIAVDASFSFDALQLRLHPAESRIRTLAAATPASLILFDMLAGPDGASLMEAPLRDRREALERFHGALDQTMLQLSPCSRRRADAQRWLERSGGMVDGVIAKRLDEPYAAGERAMLKVKRLRTADCVVGGFRYLQDTEQVGSLLLGLYDTSGALDHVGFTSTIAATERGELTKTLEKIIEPPGFTGKAPGGPSRWATERTGDWCPLRPELVVEVRYDHVTAKRFRHGTKLLRWRPDKAPEQCTFDQFEAPSGDGPLRGARLP